MPPDKDASIMVKTHRLDRNGLALANTIPAFPIITSEKRKSKPSSTRKLLMREAGSQSTVYRSEKNHG